MKKRVQIDSSILSLVIIFTGFLYAFPNLYPESRTVDNIFEFFGYLFIFTGILIRMAARGHKKAFSLQGEGLVTTGLYKYVRNPMYLGSLVIGCGFVLVLWPFWSLPIFGVLFYARFIKQIRIEEGHLVKLFKKEFEDYCEKTPRLFPNIQKMMRAKLDRLFAQQEIWDTKEKRGLILWPILAVILETFQEKVVYDVFDPGRSIQIVMLPAVVFGCGVYLRYRKK